MWTRLVVEVDWTGTGAWEDESARVMALRVRVGFEERWHVAGDVGRAWVQVENGDGRFTPGNASSPIAEGLGKRRAARVRAVAPGGGGWAVMTGWVERVVAEREAGTAALELVDGVARLKRAALAVPYHASLGVTAALEWLVERVYEVGESDYDEDGERLEHVGWRWRPEETRVWDGVKDVAETVQGRWWLGRDGVPRYRGRAWLLKAAEAPKVALGPGAAPDRLETAADAGRVANRVQVVTYPVETIGAERELWTASGVMRVAPGETREVWAVFHDAVGERCAAVDVVVPVAGLDYRVSEFRDGSGVDYTADPAFSLGCEVEATRAKLRMTNTATGALYVQFMKVRGKPVVDYAPVVSEAADAGSAAAYGWQREVFDLPMMASAEFGQALADYTVKRRGSAVVEARRAEFADRDEVGGVNLYSLEVMDQAAVTDAESGLEGARHWITAVEYEASGAGRKVTLELARSDDRRYWRLGVAGFGELGTGTRLGF